jgi:hypothetical protein
MGRYAAAIYARSSRPASDSAPVSGREVDRGSGENISSLYVNIVWPVKPFIAPAFGLCDSISQKIVEANQSAH